MIAVFGTELRYTASLAFSTLIAPVTDYLRLTVAIDRGNRNANPASDAALYKRAKDYMKRARENDFLDDNGEPDFVSYCFDNPEWVAKGWPLYVDFIKENKECDTGALNKWALKK